MKKLLLIFILFLNIHLVYKDFFSLCFEPVFAQHMTTESNNSEIVDWYDQIFVCPDCGLSFSSRYFRDKHNENDCYACKYGCGAVHMYETDKEIHEKFYCQSGVEDGRTVCSYCRAECSTIENLKQHESTCPLKPFSDNCINSFSKELEEKYSVFSVVPSFNCFSVSRKSVELGIKYIALSEIAQGRIIKYQNGQEKHYRFSDVPDIESFLSSHPCYGDINNYDGIRELSLPYCNATHYDILEARYDSETLANAIRKDSGSAIIVTDRQGNYYCTIIGYYGTFYTMQNRNRALDVKWFYALDERGHIFQLSQQNWTNFVLWKTNPFLIASKLLDFYEKSN